MLMRLFPPIFLAIGICGNIASFYAFNKSHMKAYSTFRFLSYLSIIDLLVLLTGLPQIIIIAYTKDSYDFRYYSDLICSLHSFLTMYFTHFSSILLAAVSVDRVYVLSKLRPNKKTTPKLIMTQQSNKLNTRPNNTSRNQLLLKNIKPKKYSTLKRFTNVEFITISIGCIIFAFDSHFLFWMRLNSFETVHGENSTNSTRESLCYPSENDKLYSYFFKKIWPWFDMLLYCIIPFIIMIISSTLIILRLLKLNHSVKYLNEKAKSKIDERKQNDDSNRVLTQTVKLGSNLEEDKNDFALNYTLRNDVEERKINLAKRADSSNNIQKRRARKNRQIYHVLLCLNFVFFLLVTPVVIFNSFHLLEFNNNSGILVSMCYFLAYSNHTFNFIFYLISSQPYRDILNDLIIKYKKMITNMFSSRLSSSDSNSIKVVSDVNNVYTNGYEKE